MNDQMTKRHEALRLKPVRYCKHGEQAHTSPEIYRMVYNVLGLNKNNMYDITPYNDDHDTLNEFDARRRNWSPIMNWGNFNWNEGWRYLPLMCNNWL